MSGKTIMDGMNCPEMTKNSCNVEKSGVRERKSKPINDGLPNVEKSGVREGKTKTNTKKTKQQLLRKKCLF